jgi:serpin B
MRPSLSRALIAIALAAVLLPGKVVAQDGSSQESVSESATEFAVDLYRQFAVREQRDGKNLFFSPYSIYTVLALMYGGAAGETSEQMADALHVQLEAGDFQDGLADIQEILDQIGERGAVELNIANSLWPQSGAALKPGFLELAGRYLAEIYPVDYRREPEEARGRINGWAEERTEGRIQEIVNWDLHPETHLLLANAIYFKGEWRWRFDESKTEIMPFYRLEDDPVEVPMMMQLGRFPFGMIDTVQILQLPYQGDDLSMIIVLPEDPQDLPRIEQRMSAEDILDLREKLPDHLGFRPDQRPKPPRPGHDPGSGSAQSRVPGNRRTSQLVLDPKIRTQGLRGGQRRGHRGGGGDRGGLLSRRNPGAHTGGAGADRSDRGGN